MNATRFLAPVLASLSCIGLLACESGTVRKLPPIPPATELETFFQEREDAVDILLVVDNSCSMEDEQNELANNFEAFVQFIEQVETDYHIGVVTTDVDGDPFDWFGVPGALEGEPHFITSETPDAATVFRNAVRVGTGGSGFERGFEAARLALSPQLLEEENEGFYREEALLALVFVSDEDDQSYDGTFSYLQHFRDMKGGDEDAVLAHGLIGLDEETYEPGPCGAGDPELGGATAGFRYNDFIEVSGGIAGPVCSGNFSQMLFEMGRASTGMRARFPLSWIPVEETVRVHLAIPGTPEFISGGIDLPGDGIDGHYPWRLERDLAGWWVHFIDSESLPPAESRVQIEYERAD